MAVTYSWNLVSLPNTGSAPDPGPYVPSVPGNTPFSSFREDQFARGIKFANVPGGRAENVVHGGPRVWHVNCAQNIQQETSDKISRDAVYSGAIKFRFRNYRNFKVPAAVSPAETRNTDQFGNTIY